MPHVVVKVATGKSEQQKTRVNFKRQAHKVPPSYSRAGKSARLLNGQSGWRS